MIIIQNASENNLKNISVEIPHNKITSIIGVSGSGKSTLIYSILANEAKRREKIESGNANCFDFAIRPKFDKIENLPYAVTLKQRGLNQTISSTLATVSKLHELLREEFVKYGEIVGEHHNIIQKPTALEIKEFIKKYYSKEKLNYFAIVAYQLYTNGKNELDVLKSHDIQEAIFISSYDEKRREKKISTVKSLNEKYHHTILVPFQKIKEIEKFQNIALKSFLIESKNTTLNFNIDYPDLETGRVYQKKSTQLLSFNSSSVFSGKCEKCQGHGVIEDIDLKALINKDKKLNEQFLNLDDNGKGCYKYVGICQDTIEKPLKNYKIKMNQSFYDLPEEHQQIVKDIIYPKILKHQGKPSIGKFVKSIKCLTCHGTRLNYKANAVKLYGLSISEILSLTVEELYLFLQDKFVHHKKILTILESLKKATLGYLTLDRTTDTLSGGELQRLKFALELNSAYKNLLYILDEPSTGLHPYNNHQMIHLIKYLRDKENTVIISEHNCDYIEASDYIIELGQGSGESGGEVIFSGNKKHFESDVFSRKKIDIDINQSIKLEKVNANNIVGESFTIPLKCLVAISGVSGSGKSSLIHKVLIPSLKQYITDNTFDKNLVKEIKGMDAINSVVELTQSQIGLNSRSIVATYLKIFDKIRDTYALLLVAKEFGFDKSYFSFNSEIGACETCKGSGEIDEIICPNCLGQRYKAEVLDIQYKGFNIFELLNMEVSKLNQLFDDKKLKFAFEILQKLGLSHITLGRTTPTLSGGEAQRLKLAKVLIESFHKIKKGNFLFVLDEPTTGLNSKDTAKIYAIFDEILSFDNSIIIIEHNLEIIKNSDYIIDMGLGSGKDGGKNLFSGSYEKLLKHQTSLTAKAFNKDFEKIDELNIELLNLSEKVYNKKYTYDCSPFYLTDRHFEIEKEFIQKYQVKTDSQNHLYFKDKEELFKFANGLPKNKILFNPYVTNLFKYKVVPLSIKKDRIKHLEKLSFKVASKDFELDEWEYRVEADNIEKAFNFGNGWVTIETKEKTYELFTRVVSMQDKIIGTPKVDERTFNLYLNSCIYCHGSAKQEVYDNNLIIADENKSILESGFFHSNIKMNLKSIILKFEKEKLFDFTQPYNQLSKEEQDIFLLGFKEYKFLKPKGRINALGDYIRWQGLYSYVYENLKKIEIEDKIRDSKHREVCPFCVDGFKKEVEYYENNGRNIIEVINGYVVSK